MTPACSEFGPNGFDWQDFCRPSFNIGTLLHTKYTCFRLVVSEKKIVSCSSFYKPLVVTDARGRGLFGP